jgi:hypothetical protein
MTTAPSSLDGLPGTIHGKVSTPGEAAYGTSVSIWNGAIARRPAMVVSCASTADIAAAVLFADDRGLEVSVRGAGTTRRPRALRGWPDDRSHADEVDCG